MRVDSIERCPAWACSASKSVPAARSRVRQVWHNSWLVACSSRPASGPSEDLIDPFGRQRLTASWPFQGHEQLIGGRLSRSFVVQVVADSLEEPVRHGHHPVLAALVAMIRYRRSPTSTSSRRKPSTSQRRSPAKSIPSTIERSRVRNAGNSRSASAGFKILGSVRGTRTKGASDTCDCLPAVGLQSPEAQAWP